MVGWPKWFVEEEQATQVGGGGEITSEGGNPAVAKLEEAKRSKVEEEEENQFQSFLLHHLQQHHHHQQQLQHLQQQQQQQQSLATTTTTTTVPKKQKTAVSTGKIVPVPGGHIVRSTGRKDRHSKVCTAKGLRDRRVRLSAHTAIEFYDVQDRLGYDRPSMAVDWLMKNAKAAIDELDELPPWLPTADSAAAAAAATTGTVQEIVLASAAESQPAAAANSMNSKSDAAAIAMESFFPMAAASSSYPPDLLSRTSSHVQDLRLSLESTSPNLFSFDTGSSVPLNIAETAAGGSWWQQQQQQQQQQSVIDHHQFFTQRGPLQSSASPSVPSWMDSMASATDHNNMHPSAFHHHSSVPGFDYGPGGGAGSFSGFRMPSWIQGEVDEHGGGGSSTASRKPSSSHQ